MANFHLFPPTAWDRTMRELSGPATIVRFYIMTCPTRATEGLFYLPLGILQHDTGLSAQHVAEGLNELVAAGLVSYDEEVEVVLDRTALKFAQPKGVKQIGGAVNKFKQVPDTPLRVEFYHLAREHARDLATSLLEHDPSLDQRGGDTHVIPNRNGSDRGRREERYEYEKEAEPSHVKCSHCGKSPALIEGGGKVRQLDGSPWCGWCKEGTSVKDDHGYWRTEAVPA